MSHDGHGHTDLQQAWSDAWAHPLFANPDGWLSALESSQLQKAFGNVGGVLMCIDEGVEPHEGEDAVYMAGSGILYKKDELKDPEERRKRLAADLQGKGITGVCSHKDCGACALFCKEAGTGIPEDIAQEWAKALADDLGVPYHSHVSDLRRPHFHNALVAYYDATGRFEDPARAGLPAGFTISRAIIPDAAHAAFELELATKIAMGDHGFGKLFSKEHPFHLVAVIDPNGATLSEEVILGEMQPILERNDALKSVVLRMPSQA